MILYNLIANISLTWCVVIVFIVFLESSGAHYSDQYQNPYEYSHLPLESTSAMNDINTISGNRFDIDLNQSGNDEKYIVCF